MPKTPQEPMMVSKKVPRQTPKNPPRDYQPSKGELSAEMDMPSLSLDQVRKAVFRTLKTKSKAS